MRFRCNHTGIFFVQYNRTKENTNIMKKLIYIWFVLGAFVFSIVSCSTASDIAKTPNNRKKKYLKSYRNNQLPNKYNTVTLW